MMAFYLNLQTRYRHQAAKICVEMGKDETDIGKT